jgi:hypothetical protein
MAFGTVKGSVKKNLGNVISGVLGGGGRGGGGGKDLSS